MGEWALRGERKGCELGQSQRAPWRQGRGGQGFWGRQRIWGTSRKEQGHSLSPQVSDILTPGAPQVPHLPLLLRSSPRRVWNQRDQQDQGHSFQAGHDLGTGGPGRLSASCPCGPEMLG